MAPIHLDQTFLSASFDFYRASIVFYLYEIPKMVALSYFHWCCLHPRTSSMYPRFRNCPSQRGTHISIISWLWRFFRECEWSPDRFFSIHIIGRLFHRATPRTADQWCQGKRVYHSLKRLSPQREINHLSGSL